MLTSKYFKNHRGQSHKTNIAFVALAALCAIGAIVALSAPLWRSSTAAFATTPEAFILAGINIMLAYLAIYTISRNNKISELRAPKIVVNNDRKNGEETALLVTKDTFKEMARNNQVKDEEGKVEKKYYIDFSLEGKNYRIIVDISQFINRLGNTLLFKIDSLEVKNKEGKFETVDETEKGAKEVNTYLGSPIVKQVASEEKAKS